MRGRDGYTLELIYLAVSCTGVGIVLAFITVFACQYFGVDISQNLWVLVIPVTLSISLNIGALELYRKYKKK